MYKRILAPLDGSELAETILSWVRLLAQHSDAEIMLLRVAEYPSELYSACDQYPPADPAIAGQLEEAKKAIRQAAENYLKCIAARPELAGLKVVVTSCDGPVVEAILDSAEHFRADLIMMSTHAGSGFSHWLIGAVADRVLHEAHALVLLIRPSGAEGVGTAERRYGRHDNSNKRRRSDPSPETGSGRNHPVVEAGRAGLASSRV